MKIAVITETEQVQLQALALYHLQARNVGNHYFGKVGLARLGSQ